MTGRCRSSAVRQICDEILRRQRFLLTSHARPDGDSIGSQLAMAFALDALGKSVRIVNADRAPDHYQDFPGMDRIEIADRVAADVDAVIVMECSDLTPRRRRRARRPVPDQHRSPCRQPHVRRGQLARRVGRGVRRDGVRRDSRAGRPADAEIATHIYLAILTDTGSFHHSNITPRTFDICRQTSRRASIRRPWRAGSSTATASAS